MRHLKNIILMALFVLAGVMLTAKFEFTADADAKTNDGGPALSKIYDSGNGHSKFAVIAKDVLPAVVNINIERSIEYNYISPFDKFFRSDPFLDDFFGRPRQNQPPRTKKHIQKGEGSGFVYTTDGYIMTNNHVVEKADKITVRLFSGEEYEAEIIGNDPETDLAVIKIDKEFDNDNIVKLGNSDELWVGDWVVAIGSPYSLEKTVTVGVVSAKDRAGLGIMNGPVYQDFIQTDAAINPGNSGGPLLDINGRVIGINAAVNAQAQGIGFAIPINMARKIVQNLKDDGFVKRAYLGILPKDIASAEKEVLGLDEDMNGVLIASVEKDTPAEKAGLKADDIIIEINGKKIISLEQFRFDIAAFAPGEKVKFRILREGKEKTFKVELGDRSKLLALDDAIDTEQGGSEDILGLSVAKINEDLKKKYNISVDNGLIVTHINEGSVLYGKLTGGDVITKLIVAGEHFEINDRSDLKKAAKEVKDKKSNYIIKYIRQNRKDYILISP